MLALPVIAVAFLDDSMTPIAPKICSINGHALNWLANGSGRHCKKLIFLAQNPYDLIMVTVRWKSGRLPELYIDYLGF